MMLYLVAMLIGCLLVLAILCWLESCPQDSTWDVDTASAPVALVSTGERGVAVAPWGELAVVSSEPSTDPGAGGGSQVDMLVERMRAMELMLAAERQKVQELQAANEAETREARRRSSMGAAGINLSWDMGHLDHVSPLVPQESAGANGEGGVGSIDTLVKDSASGVDTLAVAHLQPHASPWHQFMSYPPSCGC